MKRAASLLLLFLLIDLPLFAQSTNGTIKGYVRPTGKELQPDKSRYRKVAFGRIPTFQ